MSNLTYVNIRYNYDLNTADFTGCYSIQNLLLDGNKLTQDAHEIITNLSEILANDEEIEEVIPEGDRGERRRGEKTEGRRGSCRQCDLSCQRGHTER
mgnify:CR=1 FL=1